jgi:hypothetical protein
MLCRCRHKYLGWLKCRGSTRISLKTNIYFSENPKKATYQITRKKLTVSIHLSLTAMSEAKFDKAVAIIGALPKQGAIKPTQEDQLYVCLFFALS